MLENISTDFKYDYKKFDEGLLAIAIERSINFKNAWIFLHTDITSTVKWLQENGWFDKGDGIFIYPVPLDNGTYKKVEINYNEDNSLMFRSSLAIQKLETIYLKETLDVY